MKILVILCLLVVGCATVDTRPRMSEGERAAFLLKLEEEQNAAKEKEMAALRRVQRNKILVTESHVENIYGTPNLFLTIYNDSDRLLTAFEFTCYCFDDFNRPVGYYGRRDNSMKGIAQQVRVEPGQEFTESWALYGQELTTTVKNIKIIRSSLVKSTDNN
jgi:hypothetical protein